MLFIIFAVQSYIFEAYRILSGRIFTQIIPHFNKFSKSIGIYFGISGIPESGWKLF
jgi:hypothetical protein